jgi:hypothetical protein
MKEFSEKTFNQGKNEVAKVKGIQIKIQLNLEC